MDTILFRKKICIEPKYLSSQLKTRIADRLYEILGNKCSKEYGYVVDVNSDFKIHGNEIGASGNIMIDVECSVKTLKPKKGNIIEGKVFMLFDHGIFIEVLGKMKVLVPIDKTGGYKFDKISRTFKHKKKTIGVGDILKVEIDQIKYEQKKFSCIGILTT